MFNDTPLLMSLKSPCCIKNYKKTLFELLLKNLFNHDQNCLLDVTVLSKFLDNTLQSHKVVLKSELQRENYVLIFHKFNVFFLKILSSLDEKQASNTCHGQDVDTMFNSEPIFLTFEKNRRIFCSLNVLVPLYLVESAN